MNNFFEYEARNVSSARLRAINFSFLTQCFDRSDRSLESLESSPNAPNAPNILTRVDVVGLGGLAGVVSFDFAED